MLTKTIKISETNHIMLSKIGSKSDTFNDVITNLVNFYLSIEEFTDEEADFYNSEIDKFEKGILDNVEEVSLEELEERLAILESEILK